MYVNDLVEVCVWLLDFLLGLLGGMDVFDVVGLEVFMLEWLIVYWCVV